MASNKLKTFIGYNPVNISKYSEKEQRAAYGKLRAIANKRIEKLERYNKSTKAATDIWMYFGFKDRIPKISELGNIPVSAALLEVSHFLRSRTKIQDINAYERNQVKTFRKMGFKQINRQNLKKFGDFMEEVRQRNRARLRDSFRAVRVFEAAERLHINPMKLYENMEYYGGDLEAWEKVKPFESGRKGYSAYNYRKRYREALASLED